MKNFRRVLCFGLMCSILIFCSSDASAETVSVASVTVTHQHTAETGSCYTPVYHSHTDSCYSTCKNYQLITVYGSHYWHRCSVCGAEATNSYLAEYPATAGAVCNGQPTHASHEVAHKKSLTCTKTETSIDGYSLNCSISGTIATFNMNKIYNGSEYVLKIQPEMGSGVSLVSYAWSDGSNGSSCVVTANKVYSCNITLSDHGVSRTVPISYSVTDYDDKKPVISNVDIASKRATSVLVNVSASDNVGVSEFKLQ